MTESDVKALPVKDTRYVKSTGQGLYVEIHPNGSRYWIWQFLFPPKKGGKSDSIHLGTFCNASGVVMPLKRAREESKGVKKTSKGVTKKTAREKQNYVREQVRE